MHAGRFSFRPGRWPTVAFALMLPVLLAAGVWQLDRAQQKREMISALERGASATPIALNGATPAYRDIRLKPVVARGVYDPRHQFLLDNQVRDGRPGYRVLTPLKLTGSDSAILVDRGWRPASPDRSRLPALPTPGGTITVRGFAGHGPSVGIRLGPAYVGDGSWPRRVEYVDFDYFGTALSYPLRPYMIEHGGSQASRAREEVGLTPARHVGYAVQWFGLAFALVVIYVAVNTRRGRHDERGDDER